MEEFLLNALDTLSTVSILGALLVLVFKGYLVPKPWVEQRDALLSKKEAEIESLVQELRRKDAEFLEHIKTTYQQKLDANEQQHRMALHVLEQQQRSQAYVAQLIERLQPSIRSQLGVDEGDV